MTQVSPERSLFWGDLDVLDSCMFPRMDSQQTKSFLTVALMAAFADGLKDERERESIRKLVGTLGAEASIDLPALYRDVLLSRPELAAVVTPLDTPGLRQFAFEMAVGVVNSDGAQNAAEAAFLAQLAAALQLPAAATESTRRSRGRVVPQATGIRPPMPPRPDDPTPQERAKLAVWLACGAP